MHINNADSSDLHTVVYDEIVVSRGLVKTYFYAFESFICGICIMILIAFEQFRESRDLHFPKLFRIVVFYPDEFHYISLVVIVHEIETAKQLEHELFEVVLISFAAVKHVILGNAVHAARDKIDEVNAAFTGNVTEEVLALHECFILHIVEKVHHLIFHEQLEQMPVFDDVGAVIAAEEMKACRAAYAAVVLGSEAEAALQRVYDNIFLCAEERVEGLSRDFSFAAKVAHAYLGEGFGFEKAQDSVAYEFLGKKSSFVAAFIH
jgi:hypothetical protein